ncbi:MAG: hypothetical protein K2P17_02645 [Helicobacteraceae bacterium]|nr:hypothetical protein [Helicobacteraceae bacterium]
MDIFEWKDEYSIHNEHLDNQHKKLFEIAKRADNMVKEQIDSQEVKKVILELFNYMKTHFHDEELYMESIGYSKLREHKEIHK